MANYTRIPPDAVSGGSLNPEHRNRLYFYSHLAGTMPQVARPAARPRRNRQDESQDLADIDTLASDGMHDLQISMDGIEPRRRSTPNYHLGNRQLQFIKSMPGRVIRSVGAMERKAIIRLAVLMAVVVAVAVAAFILISGALQNQQAAPSENFKQLQSEWRCTVARYEANQNNQANKEASCLNNAN